MNALVGASASPFTAKRRGMLTLVLHACSLVRADAIAPAATTSLIRAIASPNKTSSAATTVIATAPTTTGFLDPISIDLPVCGDGANPFYQPANQSTLYVDKTYYMAGNPKFFSQMDSTVQVKCSG
ncbi:hypothetical protein DPSP01_010307 [Paraphaeosphaeria sporulosa]